MSDDRKVPAIPAVRVTDPAAQRVLEALKALAETREGVHDPLEKAITLRDLAQLGIVEINLQRLGKNVTASVLPTVTGEEDSQWASIPPPEVVSFSAIGLFASILLDWESPIYSNHAYTEIWRASVLDGESAPSLGEAVMVAQVTNGPWTDVPPASNDARVFYYWSRNVSTSGLKSGFSAPASAMLAVDPGYVLSVLLGQAGSEYVTGTPLLVEVPYQVTVNGVTVPPGVYIRDLYVQNGTITNAKIGNLAVDDAKIASVTATKIKTGTLEVGQTITIDGVIQGGKTAYGSSTAGFWLGNDGGTYRFSIGDNTNYMKWTGTVLEIKGTFTAPIINGGVITSAEFIGGEVKYGKTDYTDVAQGYWLGIDGGLGKLNIGDATNFITWDGSVLAVSGLIYTSSLIASEITQSVMDNSNTLIAPNFILDPDFIPGLGGGMRVAAEGQPLDDVTNPPTRLCYPAKMLDTSLPMIISSGSDVEAVVPNLTYAGVAYLWGLDTPTANNQTQPASTASRKLRAASANLSLIGSSSDDPGTLSPLWIRDPIVSVRGFVNDKLRTYDYADTSDSARCAKSTATLRVRITDSMLYNTANPAIAGTEAPPHWAFPGVVAQPSGNTWPGATVNNLGRLFQLFIYPPYTTAPADVSAAATQNAAAEALYCYRPFSGGLAQDPPAPGYVLDLSYLAESSGGGYPASLAGTASYLTAASPRTTAPIYYRGIDIYPVGGNTAFTSTFSAQGWTGTVSYGGYGGELSIVAERTIDYSGAACALGYTSKLLLASRMSVPENTAVGGSASGVVYATFLDYQWNHLNIAVEIECDNRPIINDTITL